MIFYVFEIVAIRYINISESLISLLKKSVFCEFGFSFILKFLVRILEILYYAYFRYKNFRNKDHSLLLIFGISILIRSGEFAKTRTHIFSTTSCWESQPWESLTDPSSWAFGLLVLIWSLCNLHYPRFDFMVVVRLTSVDYSLIRLILARCLRDSISTKIQYNLN